MSITHRFYDACKRPSDINEHLVILKAYAERCDTVTEAGVRNVVSTWAFLAAGPKKITSIDIHRQPNVSVAEEEASKAGLNFHFIEADFLKMDIEETDLLFIDTLHTYSQLSRELRKHADKVRKYIILHDTTTYADVPEPADWQTPTIMENYVPGDKGLWPAVEEFLLENKTWVIERRYTHNNGLTILKRVM